MNKFVVTAALTAVIGLSAAISAKENATKEQGAMAQQPMSAPTIKRNHLFEERAGTWKATCDEMEDSKVYCRMFHIEQFGEWKTKNFVQMGPAWTPENVGFVIATYLGFKEGTTVSIGVDMHNRIKVTAPKGNNLMIRPEITEKLVEQMESGNKMVITFNSYSGVKHLSLADLAPFKSLLSKVKTQMARNDQAQGAAQ